MQQKLEITVSQSKVSLGYPGVMFGIFISMIIGFCLALPTYSQAQDGGDLWGRGACGACHGTLAQGGDEGAEAPGPDLRATRLDRELILETISCGRPGTPMPFNLTGAYTEISCYDIPLGDVPPETNGAGGFSAEELETLVNFLMENVKGKKRITKQNCALFFGGNENAPACRAY